MLEDFLQEEAPPLTSFYTIQEQTCVFSPFFLPLRHHPATEAIFFLYYILCTSALKWTHYRHLWHCTETHPFELEALL